MTKTKKRLIIVAVIILGFDKLLGLLYLIFLPTIIIAFLTIAIGTATRMVIIPDGLWSSVWKFQKKLIANSIILFKTIWN
mgnify:CR=1 FL=1